MRWRIEFLLVCVIMVSRSYQRSRPAAPFGCFSSEQWTVVSISCWYNGSCCSLPTVHCSLSLLSARLAGLLLQLLVRVAHALVLVRIGLAQRTHIGSHLAHLLPVYAGDD